MDRASERKSKCANAFLCIYESFLSIWQKKTSMQSALRISSFLSTYLIPLCVRAECSLERSTYFTRNLLPLVGRIPIIPRKTRGPGDYRQEMPEMRKSRARALAFRNFSTYSSCPLTYIYIHLFLFFLFVFLCVWQAVRERTMI